jgi:hypothetical protein
MSVGRTAFATAMLALSPVQGFADDPKTYRLTIGEVAVEIDPGESLDVALPDGSKTRVTLQLNEFATYSGTMFSYVHPTSVGITRTDLDKSIRQYLMASAIGTLVLVQEYGSMNPVSLDQLMLQELTKETVQAGGQLSQEPATRTLADGKQVTGLKATVKTRTDTTHFEILGYGTTDQGLLMITRIDDANAATERKLLDKFWETLKIKP